MAIPDSVLRRRQGFDVEALLTTTEDQAIGATADGSSIRVGRGAEFEISVAASAVSGTSPTLDVVIEGSATDAFGGEEVVIATFNQVTAAGDYEQQLIKSEYEYIRAAYTIGGSSTPIVTATVAIRS